MVKVYLDEEDLLKMLTDRVLYWTQDDTVVALYEDMYDNYVYNGCFEGAELNIMEVVDNDYVNHCDVLWPPEKNDTTYAAKEYRNILKIYKEQGLGDCSEYHIGYNWIEAVEQNDNEKPVFLVRT